MRKREKCPKKIRSAARAKDCPCAQLYPRYPIETGFYCGVTREILHVGWSGMRFRVEECAYSEQLWADWKEKMHLG